MFSLLNTSNILARQARFTSLRFASTTVKDMFHQIDATPEEISIVNKRLKLKKALKAEYLRKVSDPHSTEPFVFDPQIQRYYSMHMTMTDRFVPTFKNWCIYMLTCVIPIVVVAKILIYKRAKQERLYRSGEMTYEERIFKFE